jgi:proteasome lid subunit RPN8/RPN11
MAEDNGSADYSVWAIEGHPVHISYSGPLTESVWQAAWEGLQKVPRRGLEVGGVLFGTRDGDHISIREWRPISCEHAKGPGFELSSKDEEELKALLDTPRADGFEPLGWFHSHTREGIALTRTDLDLYNRFFPAPWQVALVLRPHLHEPMRGGFFIRETDGSIRSESSYKEFIVEPRKKRFPAILNPAEAPPPPREEKRRRLSLLTERLKSAEPPQPAPSGEAVGGLAFWRGVSRRSRAIYVGLAALLLVAPFFGLPMLTPAQEETTIGFSVMEADGRLLVQWNKNARPVLEADGGTIWITDGDITRQIRLTPDDLRTSTLSYGRQTGAVHFRLSLDRKGVAHSEIADFIGDPPPAFAAAQADAAARNELQAEIARLRTEFEKETARNKEMRKAIANLERRLAARRSRR